MFHSEVTKFEKDTTFYRKPLRFPLLPNTYCKKEVNTVIQYHENG